MSKRDASFDELLLYLDGASVAGWEDVARELFRVQAFHHKPLPDSIEQFVRIASKGTAFLTFEFGIDGVSIEIARYARVLEVLYESVSDFELGSSRLHFIAGDFTPQAEAILKPYWSLLRIEGINGWSKWDEGKCFDALYFEDMPAGSQRSSELAAEIYRQATVIARKLGAYLVENEIILLIPVNVASNPGNLALTLALVLVTEALGTVVINSNHDFYWDGGKPAVDRAPGEEPGSRDHFFHNVDNRPFFSLFQMLVPWNGRRWLQVNINRSQSRKLTAKYGFPAQRVFEISTCVGEKLFEEYTGDDIKYARIRMGTILANGAAEIRSISLEAHRKHLHAWMVEQIPIVIGARDDLTLDLAADDLIYLLQPTRVIARKRIERGVELVQALLQGPLRATFASDKDRQLVLHVTGPTPIEHQDDLETIMDAYGRLIDVIPAFIAERVFLAFSGGRETHDSFEELQFDDLDIAAIFRMATAVLFPSETEGRGLPIIESAAVGVPIICSRYQPEEVFAEVTGEGLSDEFQMRYLLFPEDEFSAEFLNDVTHLLLHPEELTEWRNHNRHAVRLRYSEAALRASFRRLLDRAYEVGSSGN